MHEGGLFRKCPHRRVLASPSSRHNSRLLLAETIDYLLHDETAPECRIEAPHETPMVLQTANSARDTLKCLSLNHPRLRFLSIHSDILQEYLVNE